VGGVGSGRRSWPSGRMTVEETLRLSITQLIRAGLLVGVGPASAQLRWGQGEPASSVSASTTPDDGGGYGIRLRYDAELEGVSHPVEETIHVTSTRLCSGGARLWFECPSCGRRASALFLPLGQRFFACRACHQLTYGCRLKGCWDIGPSLATIGGRDMGL
jgi:hypothetical protein